MLFCEEAPMSNEMASRQRCTRTLGAMKVWTLRCSICGEGFERESVLAPVFSDVAPPHTYKDTVVPCLGTGQVLILHKDDNR